MTARPVLGIICCNRIVGTTAAQAVMDRYIVAAMRYADVAALLIPALRSVYRSGDCAAH
jgi:putative glutamine amidotransferase